MTCLLILALTIGGSWFIASSFEQSESGELIVITDWSGEYSITYDSAFVWPFINTSERLRHGLTSAEASLEDVATREGATFDLEFSARVEIAADDSEAFERALTYFLGETHYHIRSVTSDGIEAVVRDMAASKTVEELFDLPPRSERRRAPDVLLSDQFQWDVVSEIQSALRATYGLTVNDVELLHIALPEQAARELGIAEETESTAEDSTRYAHSGVSETGPTEDIPTEDDAQTSTPGDEHDSDADASDASLDSDPFSTSVDPSADEGAIDRHTSASDAEAEDARSDGSSVREGPDASEPPPPPETPPGEFDDSESPAPDPASDASTDDDPTSPGLDADDIASAALDDLDDTFDEGGEEPGSSEDDELNGELGAAEDGEALEAPETSEIDMEIDESLRDSSFESTVSSDEVPAYDPALEDDSRPSGLDDGLAPFEPEIDDSLAEGLESEDEVLSPYDPGVGMDTAASDASDDPAGEDDSLSAYDPGIDDSILSDETVTSEETATESHSPDA